MADVFNLWVNDGYAGVLHRFCWLLSTRLPPSSAKGFLQEAMVTLTFNRSAKKAQSPLEMRVSHPHNLKGDIGDMLVVNTETGKPVCSVESKAYTKLSALKANISQHRKVNMWTIHKLRQSPVSTARGSSQKP